MLEIKVPEGSGSIMDEIVKSLSIPVTEETFHDTLYALIDKINRGAPTGLQVHTCTFAPDGFTEQEMATPTNEKIKLALQKDNTALMLSDRNGVVFCLNYINIGDNEYLQFMTPDEAAAIARKQRQLMDQVNAPAELTTFEWICNVLSELILRHPTEAAVRLAAYRNFYENMQKNTAQVEKLTETQLADSYSTHRQHQLNAYEEAKKQEAEEKLRLEQEQQERLKKEEQEKEENRRKEQEELRRLHQFDNPNISFMEDFEDDNVRRSVTSISSQSVIAFEEDGNEEELRQNQINDLHAKIENSERELKNLPRLIQVYTNDLNTAEQAITLTSEKLILGKAKETQMTDQLANLRMLINQDSSQIRSLNDKYWELKDEEDREGINLRDNDLKLVENIRQEMESAMIRFQEIENEWQVTKHDYEDMQVDPKTYLERNYLSGKATREKQLNDQLQNNSAEIKQHEDKINEYNSQIKKLNKKKDAPQIAELKKKQNDEESAIRELKQKRSQMKKKYDESEKMIKQEALNFSQEKLDETAAFIKDRLENYHIVKSKYEATKQNVDAMGLAYQKQMNIYQNKKQDFDNKWEKQHKEMEQMQTQIQNAQFRKTENQKTLDALDKEYNALKEQNEKYAREILFQQNQKKTFEGMIKVLKENEPKYRNTLAEAKNALRQMGEPVPGEENQPQLSSSRIR